MRRCAEGVGDSANHCRSNRDIGSFWIIAHPAEFCSGSELGSYLLCTPVRGRSDYRNSVLLEVHNAQVSKLR